MVNITPLLNSALNKYDKTLLINHKNVTLILKVNSKQWFKISSNPESFAIGNYYRKNDAKLAPGICPIKKQL